MTCSLKVLFPYIAYMFPNLIWLPPPSESAKSKSQLCNICQQDMVKKIFSACKYTISFLSEILNKNETKLTKLHNIKPLHIMWPNTQQIKI